jgi:ferric-dicitrate binding protein FerR (iron transport regulator)
MVIAMAAAASLLLIIAFGWKWLFNGKGDEGIAKDATKMEESAQALVRHEVNTSGKPMAIVLNDGSEIVLWDHSEINFQEPFAADKRDITLIGRAKFSVAKDSTRPFTVYSGDISTTALGTEFTINTFENSDRIIVRLYEGKVVIKPLKSNTNLNKDVFLEPGQEFVYDKKAISRLNTFQLADSVAIEDNNSEELSRDNPSIPENTSGSWFMFNNQSLDEVFNQLAGMYHVKIVYHKEEIKNMYFIGKFEKSDSLEYILRQISVLNNLKITRKDSAFVVSR